MKPLNHAYFQENFVIKEKDARYIDARCAPCQLYGLCEPLDGTPFKRMPRGVAEGVSETVAQLNGNTSGGRVRFTTDSKYLIVRAAMPCVLQRSNMPLLCTSGFDLYVHEAGRETYESGFKPPVDMKDGYEAIHYFPDRRTRQITLYMPLFNDVTTLEIGVEPSASLTAGAAYAHQRPVLYYGSSITQGAAASRPGMSYEAQIARRLDRDFINFGFAGAARGERAIADYMAGLDYAAFVSDYDHNAPTPEHLQSTHFALYETIRAARPDVPYVMVSRPVTRYGDEENARRRAIVMDSYARALKGGDRSVYFVDGYALFKEDGMEDCLADGLHPNDLGLYRMARAIGKTLAQCLSD